MFSQTFAEWLEETYRPILGGDGEDEESAADGGDTESEDDDTEASGTGDGGTGGEEESHSDDEENEDDADLDELERIRNERDQYRQRVAAAEAAAQKAKKEARKAREEAAKKGGNWEQVAREREAELQEANERAQEAEKRAITAEEGFDAFQREVRITRIATKLAFRDPEDAITQLAKQPEASGDDRSCERALRKLADQKPYLVDQRRARGRAMTDGDGNPMLTFEQLKNMSQDEVNALWESGQVQTALSRAPNSG